MKHHYFIFLLILSSFCASCGNGNTTKSKQEQKESPYGDWEVCDYLNDFDEPTGKKYVRQVILGDFSNSATASSRLNVYLFLYKSAWRDGSVDGKMLFDEYCDGTEDFHIWEDGSPAKNGSKIIDKPNRKAYYYRERTYGGWRDIDTDEWYSWIDILRDTSRVLSFTIKGDYQDEYRFTINTDKLDKALRDAGIVSDEPRQ